MSSDFSGDLKDWTHRLESKNRKGTLNETEANMLVNLYVHANLVQLNQRIDTLLDSTEHQEGMLGALDTLGMYVGAQMGIPYPDSAAIREAMDAARDQKRLAATQAREQALELRSLDSRTQLGDREDND